MNAIGLILFTLLGLSVGSFLNVVIYRLPVMLQRSWRSECQTLLELPEDESGQRFNLLLPRSHCPSCQQLVRWFDNIPLLSYLLLKGRCRHCCKVISARYPIVELFTALITLYLTIHFGPGIQLACALIFTWALIAASLIDIDHQLLPDSITLSLLWFGLVLSVFNVFTDPVSAIFGAAIGYSALRAFIELFNLITGKQGMGLGDIKLFAAFGAWFGYQLLPFILIFSSIIGAIFGIIILSRSGKSHQQPLPFGPYLALAGLLALLYGQTVTDAYLRYAGLIS